MKKIIIALVALSLLSCDFFSVVQDTEPLGGPVGEDTFAGYIDITNNTGETIFYVYISHVTDEFWGEDQLGTSVLPDGETARFDLVGLPSSFVDVFVIDSNDGEYYFWDVDASRYDLVVTPASLSQ